MFGLPQSGGRRALLYSVVFPIMAWLVGLGVWVSGWEEVTERMSLSNLEWFMVHIGIGGFFYVTQVGQSSNRVISSVTDGRSPQIPERLVRKRFDHFGASHQLWHIEVVVASLYATKLLVEAFEYAHGDGQQCLIM